MCRITSNLKIDLSRGLHHAFGPVKSHGIFYFRKSSQINPGPVSKSYPVLSPPRSFYLVHHSSLQNGILILLVTQNRTGINNSHRCLFNSSTLFSNSTFSPLDNHKTALLPPATIVFVSSDGTELSLPIQVEISTPTNKQAATPEIAQ